MGHSPLSSGKTATTAHSSGANPTQKARYECFRRKKKFDAIVIGTGAGGGVAAKELSCAGIKTLLIERGDWPDYEDSTNDEFINQRSHIIRALHGPDRKKSPRAMHTKDGWKPVPAHIQDYSVVAACVGSGTVTYGAMAWRFMPQDFRLKSTYGEFAGSSIADWPISYDDLEPFYEKAEWEIGVSGNQRDNPFAPPRKRDFPMPPFEHNDEDIFLMKACRRLGLHPYPISMLRNSVPYNGRAACIRNRTCCGYVCPVNAKNGTQNTVIPTALKSGNCPL